MSQTTPPVPPGATPPPPSTPPITGYEGIGPIDGVQPTNGIVPTSMEEVRAMVATQEAAAVQGETTMEIQAFRGRGPQVVDLAKRAPFGWWAVAVLALVSLIDRMEQSVLAGALSSLQEEFAISDTLAGLLATAAGLVALLLVIPAGFIADRVVRTRAIAVILVLWSLLSLGTGLAANFAILFAFRLVLGAASVLNNPMTGSLLGDYYPRAARGKAYGIERLFYFLGNPLGIIMGGVIAGLFGWRWVFLGLVLPGLIIAVLVFFLKEPKRGLADDVDLERENRGLAPKLDEEQLRKRETPEVNLMTGSVWRDMLDLLKRRTLRLVIITQALLYLGLGGLFFWTPSYFERAYDLEPGASAGIAGGMGLIGIVIGFSVGLRLGDRYVGVRTGWRVLLGAIGAGVGAVALLIMAVSPILPLSVLGWVLLNVGFFLTVPAFTAALADLSGASRRGLVFALNTLVIAGTSNLVPVIVGSISDLVVSQGWADSSTSLRVSFSFLLIPVTGAILVALRARSTFDAEADEARRLDAATA